MPYMDDYTTCTEYYDVNERFFINEMRHVLLVLRVYSTEYLLILVHAVPYAPYASIEQVKKMEGVSYIITK
jgi:hypothetical protein